ncbi:MAG TPA: 16S rRNA (adenine(1518)-N(6)/adenine(1519)-N(6))-dimethyltransferase RsmA [Sphingobacterium sp.]|nr:16S rRNA (adenine(1518)-N(6)/adenine(1519)-N(6))-dimethyltransferase RsmA [Sphingobacterium sp.]
MTTVRAKKHLGQHFLHDKKAAQRIVSALDPQLGFDTVLEVGPGMGILSDFLFKNDAYQSYLIDIDEESINFLHEQYPEHQERIFYGDFLKFDFRKHSLNACAVIGNFPYNISSQILFKVLEEKDKVLQMVGMFQKEVAERCIASPGGKDYGILSVFVQAYYEVKYLFTVKAGAFNPPPKVLSGVIELRRNEIKHLDCDEKLFKKVVKAAFNQRRKTLRNALASVISKDRMSDHSFYDKRAERLSVGDFVELTQIIDRAKKTDR